MAPAATKMAAPSTLLVGVSSAMIKSLPDSLQGQEQLYHAAHAGAVGYGPLVPTCWEERLWCVCSAMQARSPITPHSMLFLHITMSCHMQSAGFSIRPSAPHLSAARRAASQAISRSLRLRAAQAAKTISTCQGFAVQREINATD